MSHVRILLLVGVLLAAANPLAAAPGAPAESTGIAWYEGNVDAAFAAGRASNKPVLLYWGAEWCPPCKQLKSAVFTRPDFIEKSRLFVAVHLDGDLPDAQKWGDVFRVTGRRCSRATQCVRDVAHPRGAPRTRLIPAHPAPSAAG